MNTENTKKERFTTEELNYPEFKKAYEKAVENDQKVFKFQGKDFLTKYAKYLIEFIEYKKNQKK